MTGKYIADHFKQIFAEYWWPDTIVSDNGTLLHQWNLQRIDERISGKPHHKLAPLSAIKWSDREVCSDSEESISQSKEEGQDLHKCLMVYRNTPLSSQLNHLCRFCQAELPDPAYIYRMLQRTNGYTKWRIEMWTQKPTSTYTWSEFKPDHHVPRASSKKWYPTKITRLCDEPRSYIITTVEGTQYRKTQTHLKPYQLQYQKTKQELTLNKHTQFNKIPIR